MSAARIRTAFLTFVALKIIENGVFLIEVSAGGAVFEKSSAIILSDENDKKKDRLSHWFTYESQCERIFIGDFDGSHLDVLLFVIRLSISVICFLFLSLACNQSVNPM